MERAPGASASAPERKKKIVIVENVGAVENAARDAANERMSELGVGENFFKRVWKQNLVREWYRQREIGRAKERILGSGDIFANVQSRRDGDHDAAMQAILERAMSDYAHEMPGVAESYRRPEDDLRTTVNSEEVKEIIRRYVTAEHPDRASFQEDCKRIVAGALFGGDEEKARQAVHHTDNLMQIAEHLRAMDSHEAALAALDSEYEVVIARVRAGVRTEAALTRTDRAIEWLGKRGATAWVNEATLAGGVAVAGILLEKFGTGLVRGRLAAWGSLGISALAGGGFAYRKEQMRVRQERVQHARERAQGKEVTPGSERREEMQQFIHGMESAADLTRTLREKLNTDLSQLGNYQSAIGALADIEARIELSDIKKIDIISYSDITKVESERTALYLAVAEAKVALRRASEGNAALQENNLAFDTHLSHVRGATRHHLLEGEEGISERDKAYQAFERRRARRAAKLGIVTGLVAGVIVQEIVAAVFHNQQGLVHGSGRGATEKLPEGVTALQSLYMLLNKQEYGGGSPAPGDWRVYDLPGGKAALRFPEGLRLSHDPDKAMGDPSSWVLRRADNSVIPLAHMEVVDGKLTPQTIEALKAQGIMPGTGEEVFQDITRVPKQITHTVPEYIESHTGKKPDWFTQIRRQFWYDQNSPYKSIGNALRLHWGGVKGTGLDGSGNYVFNVFRMTPGGSFHGKDALNAQKEIRAGNLKMLLSMSRDTQALVVEVPIRPDGNAVIDPDTPIGKMFFEKVNGKAVFKGAFAEVGIQAGEKDGVEQYQILATHGGEGSATMENPKVTPPPTTVWEEEVRYVPITTLHGPPQESYFAPSPVIPVPLPRTPLERMKQKEPYQEHPYLFSPYEYYGGPRKEFTTPIEEYRPSGNSEMRNALRQHFEEELATNPNPEFTEKYTFVLEQLRALEGWDTISEDQKKELAAKLEKQYEKKEFRNGKRVKSKDQMSLEEMRSREIARMYRMIENILIEESAIGYKPFPKEFYGSAPLVLGLERAKEVVVILDDPIGDAVVQASVLLALGEYLERNSLHKPVTVLTHHKEMLSSLEDQFRNVRLVHRDDAQKTFAPEKEYGDRYIINFHKSYEDYGALGIPERTQDIWKEKGIDPQHVMSIDWLGWVYGDSEKEEVPALHSTGKKYTKRYDMFPARFLRQFEAMFGQKLFTDISKLEAHLGQRRDFVLQEQYLKHKYHVTSDEKVIVVSAGAGVMPKEYAPEKWEEALSLICENVPNAHILFIQDPKESIRGRYEPMADRLIREKHYKIDKVVESAQYLNTLVSMADLTITPDTGIGQLAAAVGTPNIIIGYIGNPVQWSSNKTMRLIHPKGFEQYAKNEGAYSALWEQSDSYRIKVGNEEFGASDIGADQVYDRARKALGL